MYEVTFSRNANAQPITNIKTDKKGIPATAKYWVSENIAKIYRSPHIPRKLVKTNLIRC